ncbi:hypothetical protein [Burkholderia cenocepacia]|uniref:hypothetical protein n=1 Tax=Burkholderia cenocepacia TaxID=95486 RepID=UPI0024B688E5|nr:hypothetical protein [Burkholderia cenocepacia]MDI9679462.1 hypothetical protein [Burkholderia cenocepacia]
MEKVCARCQIAKPASEFSPAKRSRDGLFSYCKGCNRARIAARRAADPAHALEIGRRSKEKNRSAFNARRRVRRAENPEATKLQRKLDYQKYKAKENASSRSYKEANRDVLRQKRMDDYWRDPAAARAKQMAWRRANPEAARAWRMARIAAGKNATPSWADLDAIKLAYVAADLLMQVTGDWYEVDHVVPLRGAMGRKPVVCGLHVDYNLQVIERSTNRRKSNQTWPDMPGREA